MPPRVNETAFNYALAEVLSKCRAAWDGSAILAEKSGVLLGEPALSPDVLVKPDLISPVIIESAYEGTADVDADAIGRLGKQVLSGEPVLTVIALQIPERVRELSGGGIERVRAWLENPANTFQYAVYSVNDPQVSPASGYEYRFPRGDKNSGYLHGNVQDLSDTIELAALPAGRIEKTVNRAVLEVLAQASRFNRLPQHCVNKIADILGHPADVDVMKVAVCIWLNAMVLQGRLAHAGIASVNSPWSDKSMTAETLINMWGAILKIDYHSVFKPAMNSLKEVDNIWPREANEAVKSLANSAKEICSLRLGAIGDIAADMYPRLAADRKATAAFYTKPEVAEMLSTLAVSKLMHSNGEKTNGAAATGNGSSGAGYNIADFACGTGTLLKSAYRAVRREVQKRADGNMTMTDMAALHKNYMENHLHGADIQTIAAHLTVAGLAGIAPAVAFTRCQVISTRIKDGSIGSLELLSEQTAGLIDTLASYGEGVDDLPPSFNPGDGEMDLCILNPPYTSARGGHPLFNITGLAEESRQLSITRLKKITSGKAFVSSKAGFGTMFSSLAHSKLRGGGIFAFVLPLSAASQGSWRKWREDLLKHYTDIVVISAPQSLSADTGMAEMMLCARKKNGGGSNSDNSDGGDSTDGMITLINLREVPRNLIEAHEFARALAGLESYKSSELRIGRRTFASCNRLYPQGDEAWGGLGSGSGYVAAIGEKINSGVVLVPSSQRLHMLPLSYSPLDSHCPVGPTHDVIGHLEGKDTRGAYVFYPYESGAQPVLALWAADCEAQQTLQCAPTHYGQLYNERTAEAARLNEKRAQLFISRGLGMPSQALAAALTEKPCHGGRAWVALLCQEHAAAAYCLWFNSIFGLYARWYCGGKQQRGRAQMQIGDIKKMPSPDFCAAGAGEQAAAAKHARTVANRQIKTLLKNPLQPCAYAWRDDNRKKIDRAAAQMLQLEISEAEMQELRELWCADHTVHGGKRDIIRLLQQDGLTTG